MQSVHNQYPTALYFCKIFDKLKEYPARSYQRPGASPAGGRGGNAPPIFFLPPHGIFLSWWFWAEKTLKFAILARKNLRISAKIFFFLFFGDHLLFGGKIAISAKKSLQIPAKTFFLFCFWRSPAFWRKNCDFGQKKPSDFG